MKPFLSVYGHVALDQIMSVERFPENNTTADIIRKDTKLGGTGTNIAVTAAVLGVPTAICAFVGTDFPEKYTDFIRSKGLIMDEFVTVEEFETSQALIVNNSEMDQKVLFYQGPQGHASELNNLLTINARKSDYVHFCTGDPEYYISIMESISRLEGKIALDPAQEIYKAWDGDSLSRALEHTDYFFCNKQEAKSAYDYLKIKSLKDINKNLAVCTMGAEGSIAFVDGKQINIPLVQTEKVVDCTGAGDAYRAGFYAGLFHNLSVPESLIVASATSSFIVEKIGALSNIPTWDSVMERADKYLSKV